MTEAQQTAVDRLAQIARDACAEQLAKSTIERVPSAHDAETYPWGVEVRNKHYADSFRVGLGDADKPEAQRDAIELGRRAGQMAEALVAVTAGDGVPFLQERSPERFSWSGPDENGNATVTAEWRGALGFKPHHA